MERVNNFHKMSNDRLEEYNVLDDRVEFSFQKGMLRLRVLDLIWIVPISELISDDIMYIREIIESKNNQANPTNHIDKHYQTILPHSCLGCITIPAYGFGSHKFNWCRFSRTIARLQEEHWPNLIAAESKVNQVYPPDSKVSTVLSALELPNSIISEPL